MAGIIAPNRTAKGRRPFVAGINWGHPITHGLVFATLNDWTNHNDVDGLSPTLVGTKARTFQVIETIRGYGSTYGVGSTDKLTTNLTLPNGFTIAFYLIYNGLGGGSVGRILSTNGANEDTIIRVFGGTALAFSRDTTAPGAVARTITIPTVGVLTHNVIVCYPDTTVAPDWYFNGIASTASSSTSTGSYQDTGYVDWNIGNRSAGDRNWDGAIGGFTVWNRPLNAIEAWSLYDPATRWDMYRIPTRKTMFEVAAATGRIFKLAGDGGGLAGVSRGLVG